jgi:hypothetical protein
MEQAGVAPAVTIELSCPNYSLERYCLCYDPQRRYSGGLGPVQPRALDHIRYKNPTFVLSGQSG